MVFSSLPTRDSEECRVGDIETSHSFESDVSHILSIPPTWVVI
jgi:hypothetical protein